MILEERIFVLPKADLVNRLRREREREREKENNFLF